MATCGDAQDRKREKACGSHSPAVDRPSATDCGAAARCAGPLQATACAAGPADSGAGSDPLGYFRQMLQHCHAYAVQAKQDGRAIVGILCEFTPRELILAAGAVPVCLCGGSVKTIAAAEKELPANLCPLIKSTYGYHVLRSNPFLEMADLVIAETTCDGKKKMYELMGQTRPMHVLELPQKVDDADAREHWEREVLKLKGELERRFGAPITDCKLRDAIRVMNRERRLRRQLAELMKRDAPPLTGRQLITLKSSISGIAEDLDQYEKAFAMWADEDRGSAKAGTQTPAEANTACQAFVVPPSGGAVNAPAKAGTTNGLSCGPSHNSDRRPAMKVPLRVLMTGVPMAHGAERVLDIIEERGGLAVAMENCTGLKPILEDVDENADDPLRAIAEKYFHLPCSVMTPNARRLDVLKDLAREYRADCVIELIWQACLTYDVEAHHVRQRVEEEMGIPYLRIETDYSPSDSSRIATRVEALFETARGRCP